ncbi:MAG: 1,4-alpha-glucan branching protein GlgB [Puniceicoccales bacterium]|nr:1,4-alpha-glucan branching protein GlgB [Puniceicoccales bacterium]
MIEFFLWVLNQNKCYECYHFHDFYVGFPSTNRHTPSVIWEEVNEKLLNGRCSRPHDVLGMHREKEHIIVRTFLRGVTQCDVVNRKTGELHGMEKQHRDGIFFWKSDGKTAAPFPYLLRATPHGQPVREFEDAYRFPPTISEFDCHLFAEGKSLHIHRHLGGHFCAIDGVFGMRFAVWAPGASRVSLVGDFVQWDGRYFPMRPLGSSGIWEIFMPGLSGRGPYKYELVDSLGHVQLRSDPFAKSYEGPPHHASLFQREKTHIWRDDRWMEKRRRERPFRKTISIYEIHLGSWRRVKEEGDRPLTYAENAHQLATYCSQMGFNYVELLPICEFPFEGSWGYQTTGFFAPTRRYGMANDFKYFVDVLHRSGIGVILDWVPSHFPKDRFALAQFDGTCLYEHADSRQGEHKEWGTLVFNYGRNEVRNFLLASALSWLEDYHIDGFRVDAVSSMIYLDYMRSAGQWIPNFCGGRENFEAIDFLKEFNILTHKLFPGIFTIAEEATSFPRLTAPVDCGGIGFDFKWNMGWMHDALDYFSTDSFRRSHCHGKLTFTMLYQYSEHFILALSHDEVVHGKSSLLSRMPSNEIRQKAQMLRSLFGYMWTWPGKKTLFMGGEFGQYNEWYYARSLDWHLLDHLDHGGLQRWIRDLNHLYHGRPWLGYYDDEPCGFQWINPDDHQSSVLTYLRRGCDDSQCILVVCNFSAMGRNHYRIGVPTVGIWREVLNSDGQEYGGHGLGNFGSKFSEAIPWNAMSQSLSLFLPPHSTIILEQISRCGKIAADFS